MNNILGLHLGMKAEIPLEQKHTTPMTTDSKICFGAQAVQRHDIRTNTRANRFSYPVHGAKVDSLSEVEALVESTVVRSGKGDDKLACTLVGAIDLVIRKDGNITNGARFKSFQTFKCDD